VRANAARGKSQQGVTHCHLNTGATGVLAGILISLSMVIIAFLLDLLQGAIPKQKGNCGAIKGIVHIQESKG